MKKLLLLAIFSTTACVSSQDALTAVDDPEEMAQNFMSHFLAGKKENLNQWVVADVAFLDYNAQNSAAGQEKINASLEKMAEDLHANLQEAGIDEENLIFKPMGKTLQNNDQQANVKLHIFSPSQTGEEVKTMELITRWRKTEAGWKLDLNPYLDNFRHLKP